ncbi:MAG TPA: YdhR family protein [Actinomycetota bacterium]|nr:YdhR family protein [Actinomycetota bacterium]
MGVQIVQITYKLEGSREEYVKENQPYAQPIADVPGLRWKVWTINEEGGEAGGVYLFEDQAFVQAFLDGEIITEMKADPSLSIQTFDVIEELTTTTRGPIN